MLLAVALTPAALLCPGPAVATQPTPGGPVAASQRSIVYGGGDGTSIEQAVVILGAPDHRAGVLAEYAWLQRRFPAGGRRTQQALIRVNGRLYDRPDVELPDGERRPVFFDITDFFGRGW
jgi:hypothetical protein